MAAVEPLMIDWPPLLPSERLLLRAPRAGDGVALNEAVVRSVSQSKAASRQAQPAIKALVASAAKRGRPRR